MKYWHTNSSLMSTKVLKIPEKSRYSRMQGVTIPEELYDWRMGKGPDTGILRQEMMLTDKLELKIIDAREW